MQKKKRETYADMQVNKKNYQLQMFQRQMAETNFSLFADSCATSCNKKSMNQGWTIYSNNKVCEICHFPHSLVCLFSLFFLKMKTLLSSWAGEEQQRGGGHCNARANTITLSLKEKIDRLRNLGKDREKKNPENPPPSTTWRGGIWLWQTKHAP